MVDNARSIDGVRDQVQFYVPEIMAALRDCDADVAFSVAMFGDGRQVETPL